MGQHRAHVSVQLAMGSGTALIWTGKVEHRLLIVSNPYDNAFVACVPIRYERFLLRLGACLLGVPF